MTASHPIAAFVGFWPRVDTFRLQCTISTAQHTMRSRGPAPPAAGYGRGGLTIMHLFTVLGLQLLLKLPVQHALLPPMQQKQPCLHPFGPLKEAWPCTHRRVVRRILCTLVSALCTCALAKCRSTSTARSCLFAHLPSTTSCHKCCNLSLLYTAAFAIPETRAVPRQSGPPAAAKCTISFPAIAACPAALTFPDWTRSATSADPTPSQ